MIFRERSFNQQVINNLCYLLSGKDFNSQKVYEKLSFPLPWATLKPEPQ